MLRPLLLALVLPNAIAPVPTPRVIHGGYMAEGRSGHTATLLGDGTVLLAGGMLRNGVFSDTAEIFDPRTMRSRLIAGHMSEKKVGQSAVALPDGTVFLAGGWTSSGTSDATEIFDPHTTRFIAGPRMSVHRARPMAIALKDGTVLLAGGDAADNRPLAVVELYDPRTRRLQRLADMNYRRLLASPTLLRDGTVLVTGGMGGDRRVLGAAEIYDPASRKFRVIGDMVVARYKHTSGLLPDGRVLIAGGSTERDWRAQMDDAEIFDPTTRRFSRTADLLSKRFKLPETAVTLAGQLLVAGGSGKAELYDPGSGTFRFVAGELRSEHYMTELKLDEHAVMLAGGYDDPAEDAQKDIWIVRRD